MLRVVKWTLPIVGVAFGYKIPEIELPYGLSPFYRYRELRSDYDLCALMNTTQELQHVIGDDTLEEYTDAAPQKSHLLRGSLAGPNHLFYRSFSNKEKSLNIMIVHAGYSLSGYKTIVQSVSVLLSSTSVLNQQWWSIGLCYWRILPSAGM